VHYHKYCTLYFIYIYIYSFLNIKDAQLSCRRKRKCQPDWWSGMGKGLRLDSLLDEYTLSWHHTRQLSQQTGGESEYTFVRRRQAGPPALHAGAGLPSLRAKKPPRLRRPSAQPTSTSVCVGLFSDSIFLLIHYSPLGSAPPRRRRSCVNAVKQGSLPSHPPV
jgi:hypothetical protein